MQADVLRLNVEKNHCQQFDLVHFSLRINAILSCRIVQQNFKMQIS